MSVSRPGASRLGLRLGLGGGAVAGGWRMAIVGTAGRGAGGARMESQGQSQR